MPAHSAFFYGTLMHPKILTRVIKNGGSHLTICPAVLLDHTRHVVRNADYPGVAPLSRTKDLFDRELTREESCVRGTLVFGLTDADIKHLDSFEGEEYARKIVEVHPLAESEPLSTGLTDKELIPRHAPPISEGSLDPSVTAETYIYLDVNNLVPELWSWEDFVKKNAMNWYTSPLEFRYA
ncbi:hypothetical protein BDZ89DRAFT_1013372 [Hymenopellis radicata]|nr:hypothetical protein BDZ89DRAFT_1013372 [Hymenopellis radicata]